MVAALGVLLIGVVAVVATTPTSAGTQGETSSLLAGPVSRVIQHDQIKFLEENTVWQTLYTTPPMLSYQQMAFIEDNTMFQTPYSQPAVSYEEIRLWEENTWGYDPDYADSR
jgi:hypothetical protein